MAWKEALSAEKNKLLKQNLDICVLSKNKTAKNKTTLLCKDNAFNRDVY